MNAESSATTTDSTNNQTLHPSRPFTLIYLIAALAMDALGVFILVVATPIDGIVAIVVGSAVLLFFGVASLIFAIQLGWPAQFGLTLDSQGFTVRMNFGSRRYLWKEVDHFFLVETVPRQPVVAFRYLAKPETHGLQWTRGLSRRFDGTLPQNLRVRGARLRDLVEGWRLRAAETK